MRSQYAGEVFGMSAGEGGAVSDNFIGYPAAAGH
jgi:hypothetical protein